MIPIKLFNQYSESESDEHKIEYLPSLLTVPTGLDKYQYEVKLDPEYKKALRKIQIESHQVFFPKGYCFYCGTQTDTIVAAFFHDGSGYNLWMYTDWTCSSIICETCLNHYGSNNLRYFKKINAISKNKKVQILSFEPEVLLPSLEPSHLHFNYTSSGYLEPLTQRGRRTIDRFALNRTELVQRRLRLINSYNIHKYNLRYTEVESPVDVLFLLVQNSENEADFRNYLIQNIRKENLYYLDFFGTFVIPYKKQLFIPVEGVVENGFHTNFSGISSIIFSGIRDFKKDQTLSFKGKKNIILIGENGVGKSTILELIKRAIKPNYKRNLDDLCSNQNYLPHCIVKYENIKYQLEYVIEKKFHGLRNKCNLVHISESRSSSRNANLLADWISRHTDYNEIIHWVARKLKILLSLPQEYYFCTIDKNVYWEKTTNSPDRVYLSDFSSGYNSILTIFYKVLSGITSNNTQNSLSDIKSRLSSTVVLIDEIELHLHPKFKKNIVKNLKNTFPEVTFIITTHDPLIFKSTDKNDSIVLIEKVENESTINPELPDHTFLTTEQILSSPIFGLGTLEDSDLINESLIEQYYSDLKNKKWEKVNEFRDRLGKSGYFGKTYRELIALSAVDAYLSNGKVPEIENIVNILTRMDNNEKY